MEGRTSKKRIQQLMACFRARTTRSLSILFKSCDLVLPTTTKKDSDCLEFPGPTPAISLPLLPLFLPFCIAKSQDGLWRRVSLPGSTPIAVPAKFSIGFGVALSADRFRRALPQYVYYPQQNHPPRPTLPSITQFDYTISVRHMSTVQSADAAR
ncbi:hypothetical protein BDZ89DRAFT_621634 [Hymenopellis radicata]|nr:hypothetical protein BDZ89DRAFT_621634 [Hymenopellis radicata]